MMQQPELGEKFGRRLRERFGHYFNLLRSLTPDAYRARRAAAIFLAVSPPLICALFVTGPDRWALFERSGSLTTAIGLLLASRRYLHPGIFEMAIMNRKREPKSDSIELVEDIYTQKLGLAVSAFGTIIWGWGTYLRWWTFSYLILWAAIAAYDAWRDFVRLRDTTIDVATPEKSTRVAGAD
jgi:hypothetical protein